MTNTVFPTITQPMRHIILIPLLLILAGCAKAVTAPSVPEEQSTQAIVKGFPAHIRFWADEAPDYMSKTIHTRLANYRSKNAEYFAQHHSYPSLHYLAISGGAYDGAFGAGLLSGWNASGTRPQFSLVTGVSTGALIAPFAFLGAKYDDRLHDFFTNTTSDKIFMTDAWKVLEGLTGGLAVTDSAPLALQIQSAVTPEVLAEIATEYKKGRLLYIVTTNIEAQRGVLWDIGAIAASENPNALKLVHQIMLASAAVPGLFQPVFIDVEVDGKKHREIHADGGVTSQVFAYPIRLHRGVMDEFRQHNITQNLYIIRNSKISPEYKVMDPGLFSLTGRAIETLIKQQSLGDLYRLYVSAKRDGVHYHMAAIPASFRVKSNAIFDPAYMGALYDVGYQMGKGKTMWDTSPPGVDYIEK
jgi:predicted acylesterase/phospholipase RssA